MICARILLVFIVCLFEAGTLAADLDRIPEGWRRIDVNGRLSFSLPPEIHLQSTKGKDSVIRTYRGNGIELSLDYGQWSDPLEQQKDQNAYHNITTKIDGISANIVTYINAANNLHYVAAIHFPAAPNGPKLTIFARCNNVAIQQVAQKIFHTIRFTP